jgi:plasmid stabilization system protein ParE
MIQYERFLECHLDYLEKHKRAESELQARRNDLFRSLDSLISHPETGKVFKTHLLEVRRNL